MTTNTNKWQGGRGDAGESEHFITCTNKAAQSRVNQNKSR